VVHRGFVSRDDAHLTHVSNDELICNPRPYAPPLLPIKPELMTVLISGVTRKVCFPGQADARSNFEPFRV
jgi:hypothetical protein